MKLLIFYREANTLSVQHDSRAGKNVAGKDFTACGSHNRSHSGLFLRVITPLSFPSTSLADQQVAWRVTTDMKEFEFGPRVDLASGRNLQKR
jgi:hypothetical protein